MDKKSAIERYTDRDDANVEYAAIPAYTDDGRGPTRRMYILDRYIDHDTGKVIYVATHGDRFVMNVSDLPPNGPKRPDLGD